jgi:hypothetical protein
MYKGTPELAPRPREIEGKMMRRLVTFIVLLLAISLSPAASQAAPAPKCGWDSSPGWVARENGLPGYQDWAKGIRLGFTSDYPFGMQDKKTQSYLDAGYKSKYVQGWLDSSSATCGKKVALHLRGNNEPVIISLFRIGYYGDTGARLVKKIITARVREETRINVSPAPEKIVYSEWPTYFEFIPDESTPPGQYVFRLDDKYEKSTLIPLTIVDTQSTAPITFVSSVFTWQMYNHWGGYSAYKGPNLKRATRGVVTSFNRPYDGDGSGQLRYMEAPVISKIEQLGIDTNYITDFELDGNPSAIARTKSVVFGGHAEYWTSNMRKNIEYAIAHSVNLINLGGNAAYNRPALQNKNRELVMWRDSGLVDPNGKDPLLATRAWRDAPISQPESIVLGSQYVGLGLKGDYRITRPNAWPMSVLPNLETLKNVVGREVDSPLYSKGPAVQVLARTTVTFRKRVIEPMATYYNTESLAGVINVGTNGWVCGMENICPWHPGIPLETQSALQALTGEILIEAAKGPLGKTHPAKVDVPARP